MAKKTKQPEVILQVGAEGGGYTILGEQHRGAWRFWREPGCGDSWMYDDEDEDVERTETLPLQPRPEPTINYSATLDEVLGTINECWPHLIPIAVHPVFVQDIWQRAVNYWRKHDTGRTDYVLPRWSGICLGREIHSFEDLVKEEQARASSKTPLSVAWAPFVERLAAVLAKLKEGRYLILLVKDSDRFVQFAAQGSRGMRVETTSNAYLSKTDKLNKRQITALHKSGWNDPTGSPDESTPENDPEGSPNFFIEFPDPVSFAGVGNLAVYTLAEILGVPSPNALRYDAFTADGKEIAFPRLGLPLQENEEDDTHDGDKFAVDSDGVKWWYYVIGNNIMKNNFKGGYCCLNDDNEWEYRNSLIGYFYGSDLDAEELKTVGEAKKHYAKVTGGEKWVP